MGMAILYWTYGNSLCICEDRMTGRQHTKVNLAGASIITVGSIVTGQWFLLVSVIGVLYSIVISPDSDVDAGFIGYHYVRKVFGNFGHWYWTNLWKPYAKNFKHRGVSHIPVVGTLTRLIYVLLPVSVYLLPYDKDSASFASVIFAQLLSAPLLLIVMSLAMLLSINIIILFIIGVIVGDILHIFCDWI